MVVEWAEKVRKGKEKKRGQAAAKLTAAYPLPSDETGHVRKWKLKL